jgi:hypothetical protein
MSGLQFIIPSPLFLFPFHKRRNLNNFYELYLVSFHKLILRIYNYMSIIEKSYGFCHTVRYFISHAQNITLFFHMQNKYLKFTSFNTIK